jgi:adenosylhomocysteine nucleosidase
MARRSKWMVAFLLVACFVFMGISTVSAQGEFLDDTPRVAVMSAFTPELQLLLSETESPVVYTTNGVEFTTGTLAGNDVVLLLSGVSMVNAAMNTQLLFDNFNVTELVFSGIAGGVNPELNIGDVTVPGQWAQYLESFFGREMEDGSFQIPGWADQPYPNYGMMFPQTINVRTEEVPEGAEYFWFPVDPDMLEVAQAVASSVELAQCPTEDVCLENAPQIVVGGNGVSGQVFVDNAAFREYAFETFGGVNVLDMESAASAMVAFANDVPFVAFRSLSDLAGGGPGENEIGVFFQVAADNSATVVIAFLEVWAAR